MKLLSVAIPCYNSAAYMRKCIESLLSGGEDVEILVVNDGSTDETPGIAMDYVERYPHIVKLISQKNGGHGAAVNTGIREASGLYFKVVDSDDWVKEEAYREILETLRRFAGSGEVLDMLISNFVYEKVGERNKVMRYRHPQSVEYFRFYFCGSNIGIKPYARVLCRRANCLPGRMCGTL